MRFKIATWNINSVRLRAGLVTQFLADERPHVLLLQEIKSPTELVPGDVFAEVGYRTLIARGEPGYNGVLALARVPLEDGGHRDFCGRQDTRHQAVRLEGGVEIHNFYVPAGGDEPDPEANPKFAHKLQFLEEMREMFASRRRRPAILVGDLNVAPLEHDVWSHAQMRKVVSHTEPEITRLEGCDGSRWLGRCRAGEAAGARQALYLVVIPGPRLGGVRPRPSARPYLGDTGCCGRAAGCACPQGCARLGAAFRPRTDHCGIRSVTLQDRPARVAIEGPIGRLTLDRPDKRNALGRVRRDCLSACPASRNWAACGELRAVVVEGAGEGVFSAGLEFSDIHHIDWRENPFTLACDALECLSALTVCAVRDGAYGAGVDLALACDFRIGTPACRVRVPAAALGVHYDRTGLERGIRCMGLQGARRMFLAAETLDAPTLLRLGFLDEIVEAPEVGAWVEERAAALASLAPIAVRGLKASLVGLAAGTADAAEVDARVGASWESEDFREGVAARDGRRKPVFRGH